MKSAGPPVLTDEGNLTRDIHRIDSTSNRSMHITDWNSDGRKDLLNGFWDGRVKLSMNDGTPTNPSLQDGTWVQVGYSDLDVGNDASPFHYDWDADGKRDLLVGDNQGQVQFFQNTGSDSVPTFNSSVLINAGYSTLDVGSDAAPFPVDWNNDGKDDLVVAGHDGRVRIFLNEGTNSSPQLDGGTYLQVGYNVIDTDSHARPWVTDWNGDGKKDLLCYGTWRPRTYLYINEGTDSDPQFDTETLLYGPDSKAVVVEYGWSFGDMNGDGAVDFVACLDGRYPAYYPNKGDNSNRIYEEAVFIPGNGPHSLVSAEMAIRTIDWDEDGRKDLFLTGHDFYKRSYLFFNSGTNAAPEFTSRLALTTTTGKAVGFDDYHSPDVVDWNNDGKKDIVAPFRDYTDPGNIYVYLNTNENYAPEFGDPFKLTTGYIDVGPEEAQSLTVADWDSDGKKDLVISSGVSFNGVHGYGDYQYVFLNRGSDAVPYFTTGTVLKYHESGYVYPIRGLWENNIQVWDYEEDGDPDILMCTRENNDYLMKYTNNGSPGSPYLVKSGFLEAAYGYVQENHTPFIEIVDWDEDGKKDILLGTYNVVSWYSNSQSAMTSPGEVQYFTVAGSSDYTVSLTWDNPTDNDFAGVIIVRSHSTIDWRPSDRQHYHVTPGVEVAPGVEVVYKGAADHSTNPWTDAGLTPGSHYYYRAFAYDAVLPSWSVNGVEVDTMTSGDTPTPGPSPTFTPTSIPTYPSPGPPEFEERALIKREAHWVCDNCYEVYGFAVDWDNDGKQDLLTGDNQGMVRISMNVGTVVQPSLADSTQVSVGYNPIDVGYDAHPIYFDWNADGRRDLLVGEGAGRIYYYENQGSDSSPDFAPGTFLNSNYSTLDIGSAAKPFAVDWNNDGKDDLVCGEHGGKVKLFINNGTNGNPQLDAGSWIQVGYSDIDVGYRAKPWVRDWNGDGKKDLIVSSQSPDRLSVFYNDGTDADPSFSSETVLYGEASMIKLTNNVFSLADMNGDGIFDLVQTGDRCAASYFPNIGSESAPEFEYCHYIPGTEPTSFCCGQKAVTVVDWDENGVQDLLLRADWQAANYVVYNTGTNESPTLTKHRMLTTYTGVRVGVFGDRYASDYAVPEVLDWNNDGKKDLLVPRDDYYSQGDIYLYLNTAENYDPVFAEPVKLTSGGYNDLGPEGVQNLETVDWNDDGKKDLLVASNVGFGNGDYLYLYLNEGTDDNPQFSSGSVVKYWDNGYQTPIGGSWSFHSRIWDYEEDGDLDLLVNTDNYYDRLHSFINQGVPGAPSLYDDGFLQAGYGYLETDYNMCSNVTDWNADGKKDIVAGGYRGIYYFLNTQSDITAPHEVTGFQAVSSTADSISMTWTNPGDIDFDGVLIVRSESPIVWEPTYRQHYHVNPGTEVAEGVEIVYMDVRTTRRRPGPIPA